jgi:hypothetical protein
MLHGEQYNETAAGCILYQNKWKQRSLMNTLSDANDMDITGISCVLSSRDNRPVIPVHPPEVEACQIIFKDSVRTSKRTPHFTITRINWLMLFKQR